MQNLALRLLYLITNKLQIFHYKNLLKITPTGCPTIKIIQPTLEISLINQVVIGLSSFVTCQTDFAYGGTRSILTLANFGRVYHLLGLFVIVSFFSFHILFFYNMKLNAEI